MSFYPSPFFSSYVSCGALKQRIHPVMLRDSEEPIDARFEQACAALSDMLRTLPTLAYPLSDEEAQKIHAALDDLVELQRVLRRQK